MAGLAFHALVGAKGEQSRLAPPRESARVLAMDSGRNVFPGEPSQHDVLDLHKDASSLGTGGARAHV
jgi:hypothetical protein